MGGLTRAGHAEGVVVIYKKIYLSLLHREETPLLRGDPVIRVCTVSPDEERVSADCTKPLRRPLPPEPHRESPPDPATRLRASWTVLAVEPVWGEGPPEELRARTSISDRTP